ncbi:MAG: hypothetical protein M9958_01900 [Chitinophagales bacterium]|nr:hypothetical protein [Chitinophagales bacterium]
MKQIFYKMSCLLFFLLSYSTKNYATNLTHLSYYIDGDTSQIVTLPLVSNTSIDTLITLTPDGLSQGLHQLALFVQDDDEKRSLTQEITFYYIYANSSSSDITKVEFIIDSLPPQVFNITPTHQVDQTFTLNTEDLTVGMHTLKVVTYGDDGIPSLNNYISFLIHSGTGFSNQLSAFEVIIDNDTSTKQVIEISSPSSSFNDEIAVSLANVSQGMHQVNITSIAQNGLRSLSNYGSFIKVNGTNTDSIVALEYFF